MHRIRVLRILVPILLLGFLVVIALTLRSRPRPSAGPADSSTDQSARMEGFRFSDLVGGRRRLLVQARVGRVDDQGAFEVEQVERFRVDRGSAPLLSPRRGAARRSRKDGAAGRKSR
jgi:hypothetical protein